MFRRDFLLLATSFFGVSGSFAWVLIFLTEGAHGSVLLEPNTMLRIIELAVATLGTVISGMGVMASLARIGRPVKALTRN